MKAKLAAWVAKPRVQGGLVEEKKEKRGSLNNIFMQAIGDCSDNGLARLGRGSMGG